MVALTGCGSSGQEAAPAGTSAQRGESSFASAARKAVSAIRDGHGVLLDVRSDAEYAAGHANGAKHVPLDALQAGDRPDIAKDRAV